MPTRKKPIDKVTVEILDVALRTVNIQINKAILDKVIDVIDLIETKGDKTNVKDMCQLMAQWKKTT